MSSSSPRLNGALLDTIVIALGLAYDRVNTSRPYTFEHEPNGFQVTVPATFVLKLLRMYFHRFTRGINRSEPNWLYDSYLVHVLSQVCLLRLHVELVGIDGIEKGADIADGFMAIMSLLGVQQPDGYARSRILHSVGPKAVLNAAYQKHMADTNAISQLPSPIDQIVRVLAITEAFPFDLPTELLQRLNRASHSERAKLLAEFVEKDPERSTDFWVGVHKRLFMTGGTSVFKNSDWKHKRYWSDPVHEAAARNIDQEYFANPQVDNISVAEAAQYSREIEEMIDGYWRGRARLYMS